MPILNRLPESILQNRRTAMAERAYFEGARLGYLLKAAGDTVPATSLAGRLYISATGWGLLSVPNAVVRGLFDALDEPGVELPLRDGRLEAHISVLRREEVDRIGGPDRITERGHSFRYNVGQLKTVVPAGWDDVSRVYLVEVQSPELKALRRSYGLTPLPGGDHEFHITVAVVRKHVLRATPVSKAAGEAGVSAPPPGLSRDVLRLLGAGTITSGLAGTALANRVESWLGADDEAEPAEPRTPAGRINRDYIRPAADAVGAVAPAGAGALAGLISGSPLAGAGVGAGLGALAGVPGFADDGGATGARLLRAALPGALSGVVGGGLSALLDRAGDR